MYIHEITNGRDISQLDYFVYAVKFQPLFPTMMIVSVLYILSVIGFYLIKIKSKWVIRFWGLTGSILILFSGFIYKSFTIGSFNYFWIIAISGLLFIAVAIILLSKSKKNDVSMQLVVK